MEYAMKNLKDIGFPEYCVDNKGRVYSLKSRRFLNLQYNDNGYICVTLRVDGKTKTLKVHRLVAMTYLADSFFDGAHVNHIDGDKSNNEVSNLEWVTRSKNMQHAYQTGLVISKSDRIQDDIVHEICLHLEQGSRVPDVASMFGITRDQVYRIISGTAYNYISFEYNLTKVPKQQKLSPETVVTVCENLNQGLPVKTIAEKTGVNLSTVKAIKYRKTQTHISSSFDW